MNTKIATAQIRIAEWAAIIKDCKSSGMKVDDYCQQHDISRDAYARNIVVNHVNTVQLMTYYSLGRWIVETQQMAKHEQNMEAGLLKHYQKNCKKNLARDFQKIL